MQNKLFPGINIDKAYVPRLLIYALIVVFFYVVPEPLIYSGKTFCLHKMITGIECPLCGMTRSLHSMLHFRLVQSFHYNFAGIILLGYVLMYFIGIVLKKKIGMKRIILFVLILSFIVLYIIRITSGL